MALEFGEDGADGRPTAGRLGSLQFATGEALDRVVSASGSDHGANDRELIHHAGHLREEFADLDAGDVGGDGVKFAANAGGGFRFDVPHVLVWRATSEEDHDDGLVIEFFRGGGFGLEKLGEGGPAEAEAADAEEAATGHAIAEGFAFGSGNCEHSDWSNIGNTRGNGEIFPGGCNWVVRPHALV